MNQSPTHPITEAGTLRQSPPAYPQITGKQRLTRLRRRLISLPAEVALTLSNTPWLENHLFYPRYQVYCDRHCSHLPVLSEPDQPIVQALEQDGLYITSLTDLNLPNTTEFLQAAQMIFAQLQQRATPGQGSLNASFDQLLQHPALFRWGLADRLLHIAAAYLRVPVAYDTFTCTLTLKRSQEGGTRLWHIDHEDRRMIKLIIYLNDVDEDGGPFQRLNPAASEQLLARVPSKFDFLTQQELERYLPSSFPDALTSCTGQAGTVIFVDTARVYHRGKPPTASDRQAVFFGYLSRRPRHPFRCGRSLLSPKQLKTLSAPLPSEKQACVHWKAALPPIAKLIPRYRYYNL